MYFVYGTRTQSGQPRPLGVATFETSWFTETTEYPRRERLTIYLDLSSEQPARAPGRDRASQRSRMIGESLPR